MMVNWLKINKSKVTRHKIPLSDFTIQILAEKYNSSWVRGKVIFNRNYDLLSVKNFKMRTGNVGAALIDEKN